MKIRIGFAFFVLAFCFFLQPGVLRADDDTSKGGGTADVTSKQDATPQVKADGAKKDEPSKKDSAKKKSDPDKDRLRALIDWEMSRLNRLGTSSKDGVKVKLPKDLAGTEGSDKDGLSLDQIKALLEKKNLTPAQEKELLGALRVANSELKKPETAGKAAHKLTRDELAGIRGDGDDKPLSLPESILQKLTGKKSPITAGQLDKILGSKEFDPGKLSAPEWNRLLGQLRLTDSKVPGPSFLNSLALDRYQDNLFRATQRLKRAQPTIDYKPYLFRESDDLPMTPISAGGPLSKPAAEFRVSHPQPIGGWAPINVPTEVYPPYSGGGGGGGSMGPTFPALSGGGGGGGGTFAGGGPGGGGQLIGQGGEGSYFPGGTDAFSNDIPERPGQGEHSIKFVPGFDPNNLPISPLNLENPKDKAVLDLAEHREGFSVPLITTYTGDPAGLESLCQITMVKKTPSGQKEVDGEKVDMCEYKAATARHCLEDEEHHHALNSVKIPPFDMERVDQPQFDPYGQDFALLSFRSNCVPESVVPVVPIHADEIRDHDPLMVDIRPDLERKTDRMVGRAADIVDNKGSTLMGMDLRDPLNNGYSIRHGDSGGAVVVGVMRNGQVEPELAGVVSSKPTSPDLHGIAFFSSKLSRAWALSLVDPDAAKKVAHTAPHLGSHDGGDVSGR